MIGRLSMVLAAALVVAGPASHAAAQYAYRGGPIYGGPFYGGGPSLFTGAYAPPYYPYPLTGAGFGNAYIGSVPYGGGGGVYVMPASNAPYYPYNFQNVAAYPIGQPLSSASSSPSPIKPPNPPDGSRSPGDIAGPPIPSTGTGRAHFTVKVPADAKLLVNDVETKATGSVRRFHTPATLEAGKAYEYTFRAQWMENNQPVTRDRTVRFKPGEDLPVDLTEATAR
jgi:uncharacterized protein (TIGR03000 family)